MYFTGENMKHIWIIGILSFFVQSLSAQTGDAGYTFLRYPASARANALGGNTVSLVERDPSLMIRCSI